MVDIHSQDANMGYKEKGVEMANQEFNEDSETTEPWVDFILQKNKPLKLIVRRDLREHITVVTPSTLDSWLIGQDSTQSSE